MLLQAGYVRVQVYQTQSRPQSWSIMFNHRVRLALYFIIYKLVITSLGKVHVRDITQSKLYNVSCTPPFLGEYY